MEGECEENIFLLECAVRGVAVAVAAQRDAYVLMVRTRHKVNALEALVPLELLFYGAAVAVA